MPIFEYLCKSCNRQFEVLMNGGSPKPQCPLCHSRELEQQFSAFAVGSTKGKGRFGKSAGSGSVPRGGCGSCGDPRGPGSCSN